MSQPSAVPVLGIDLGTVNTRACFIPEGTDEPVIIRPDPRRASDLMPSVFCNTDEKPLVGAAALDMLRDDRYRDDVVRGVKRYMKYENKTFDSGGIPYSPTEISGFYLKAVREAAERQLGLAPGSIDQAVVTVPANFGALERRLTKEAGEKYAGFSTVWWLDEPIAAAIGLGLHKTENRPAEQELILVADLGGGTFDATLLYTNPQAGPIGFQELARDGDDHLGGIDWDKEIVRLVVKSHIAAKQMTYDEAMRREVLDDSNVRMYEPCESAKLGFCAEPPSESIPILCDDRRLGRVEVTVSRKKFLERTAGLANCCARICDRLLENVPSLDVALVRRKRPGWKKILGAKSLASITWADVDRVIVVGGGGK